MFLLLVMNLLICAMRFFFLFGEIADGCEALITTRGLSEPTSKLGKS